jgi:hypothetical protein
MKPPIGSQGACRDVRFSEMGYNSNLDVERPGSPYSYRPTRIGYVVRWQTGWTVISSKPAGSRQKARGTPPKHGYMYHESPRFPFQSRAEEYMRGINPVHSPRVFEEEVDRFGLTVSKEVAAPEPLGEGQLWKPPADTEAPAFIPFDDIFPETSVGGRNHGQSRPIGAKAIATLKLS